MPTIKLPKKKPEISQNKRDYQEIYQDPRWKRLRDWKVRENPLCEICEGNDRVEIATEVHHIIPFQRGRNAAEREKLAFDIDNLQSLCTECHHIIHDRMKGWK